MTDKPKDEENDSDGSAGWVKNMNLEIEEEELGSNKSIEMHVKADISMAQALKDIAINSLMGCGALLLRRVAELINYAFIGRIDQEDYLSGVGLGISTITIVCISFGIGLSGGIETLASQAFGNGSNYLAGCYYTRGQVILTILFIPQAIILYFAPDILALFGSSPLIAQYAGTYIRYNLLGVWAFCQTELLRRFLSSQRAYNLILYVQIVTTVIHPIWLYVFYNIFKLGIEGISIATCITYSLNFFVCYFYITYNKSYVREDSWHFVNKHSFIGLIEYLKYGAPSMVMIVLEAWCFQSLMLMSFSLGANELSVSVITLNIEGIVYLIAIGSSFAVSGLIGNSLGGSHPENAKKYATMSIVYSLILSAVTCVILLFFGTFIVKFFTKDPEIESAASKMIPVLMVLIWGDYVNLVNSGTIRALGKQNIASIFSVVCFWIIVVPLGYVLGFKVGWGVVGIWIGVPIGLTIISGAFIWIIYSSDLVELSQKVIDRIEKEKQSLKYQHFLED